MVLSRHFGFRLSTNLACIRKFSLWLEIQLQNIMAPQFCLPEPHRYEFAKAPKSILWPAGHILHRPFVNPLPDSWKMVPKEKEVEIDEQRKFIFLPTVSKGRQPKYEITTKPEEVEELGYFLYEHCSSIFDPVVVRKIPFNGSLLTVSCSKVPEGRMQISARLISGREVFCKEYPLDEKVRVFNLRFEIQKEIINKHGGSCNSTFHLVLEGQFSCLRGNAMIGLPATSFAAESKEKKGTTKKNVLKKKTRKRSKL